MMQVIGTVAPTESPEGRLHAVCHKLPDRQQAHFEEVPCMCQQPCDRYGVTASVVFTTWSVQYLAKTVPPALVKILRLLRIAIHEVRHGDAWAMSGSIEIEQLSR